MMLADFGRHNFVPIVRPCPCEVKTLALRVAWREISGMNMNELSRRDQRAQGAPFQGLRVSSSF